MKKLLIVIAAVAAAAMLFGCAASKIDPAPKQDDSDTRSYEDILNDFSKWKSISSKVISQVYAK